MKRLLALCLLLVCLVSLTGAHAAEDYTVAEKLVRQLWAGSGFSGTLAVDVQGRTEAALSTRKPIVLALDYIYVRPEDVLGEQHRLDLTLMDDGNAKSALHVQLKDGVPALQADLLGADWYALAAAGEDQAAQAALSSALAHTAVPSLAATALSASAALGGADGLDSVLDKYLTRIDLWIEGYRQDAVLDKLEDGTTTMQVSYAVPPAAIRAQVKQLIWDLLEDDEALGKLQDALGEEAAAVYLNPLLKDWYFDCIEAVPLAGDLTISRTVSVKGETLDLALALPLYDREGGAVAITYDRSKGEGDLPDSNVIHVSSDLHALTLRYQEYSSMTGVEVIQGALESAPAQGEALSVGFTLRLEESETKDEENRDVYALNAKLTLVPAEGAEFPETEIDLKSQFVSRELKSAATEVAAQLTFGGDGHDSAVTLRFEGASRKKWEPEALPAPVEISQMSDLEALLPRAAVGVLALMEDYIQQPASTQNELTQGS